MKPETLLRLYPRAWRERYGDEFVALLEKEGTGPRVVASVLAGAFDAWMSPKPSNEMALDGPFGPSLLFTRTDMNVTLYSTDYWFHTLGSVAAALTVWTVAVSIWPGEPYAFVAFVATYASLTQLRVFRAFSLRTRIAAVFWAFAGMTGAAYVLHRLAHLLYDGSAL